MATTTNYGWETPDDTDLVKDGALAQRTTGSAIDTTLFGITGGKNVGLQSIYSATFTSASTVSVDNVFTSAYDNYRIEIRGSNGVSSPSRLLIRMINSSGSIISAANSWLTGFQWWRTNTNATGTEGGVNTTACVAGVAGSYTWAMSCDVIGYNSEPQWLGKFNSYGYANDFSGWGTTVGHRGFAFITDSGTMSGTVRVYGYRN